MRTALQTVLHTRQLLQYGVFDHLTDEIISDLYCTLVRAEEENTAEKLFSFWRQADFSSHFASVQLLQKTNLLLQSSGRAPIEDDFREVLAEEM